MGLLGIPPGRFHFLWHMEGILRRNEPRRNRLLTTGILAISILPPVDFLYLPAYLSRSQGMQAAGLILCALGLLFLLRSIISQECWTSEAGAEPEIRRRSDFETNAIHAFLFNAGISLWAMGICVGFGSVLGSIAILLLLMPGWFYKERGPAA
jgi:hypothetical protein